MDFSNQKISILRDLCKKNNLKSSGTKKDMIKRLSHLHFLQKKINPPTLKLFKYNSDYYRSLQSYDKIYSFLIKKSNNEISAKLNNQTNSIESLNKNDILYCIHLNLPISIPLNIIGDYDTHRVRHIVDDDDDDDDELQEEE